MKQTYLIICTLLGLCLTACMDDDPVDNTSVVDGNMIEVSISTTVPAITIQTRAEAGKEEKRLKHVDVLVFKVEDQVEKFAYRTAHTNDLSGLDYDQDVTIKTRLQMSEEDEKYRIVFIANLKEALDSYFGGNESAFVGIKKEELFKEITFTQEEKWGSLDEHPLPMWGEASLTTTINKNTTSGSFGTMSLRRSVARIEISTASGLDESLFEMKSVTVHNARRKGLVVPDPGKFDADIPSLTGSDKIAKDKMMYGDIEDNTLTGIYVNEAANLQGTDKEADDALFLILEAVYKGDDLANKTATFYKVGFYDTKDTPVDILRNFTYNVIIAGVHGPGEEDEDKAINSVSKNITVALTDWSNGEMKQVVFNNHHYLAVSESTMELSKPAGSHSFKVKTNFPGGWRAEITEGNTWLQGLNPLNSGNEEVSEPLSFTVIDNKDGMDRTGKISISCGENHLTLDVLIIQTTEDVFSITMQLEDKMNPGKYIDFDNTVTFHSGYHREITPRKIKVNWTPADQPLVINPSIYFAWGGDTGTPKTYTDGEAEFEVVPTRMTERDAEDFYPGAVGEIRVEVGEEKQTIIVRRRHHEVYIERADRYSLDGGEHSFWLYSNTLWEGDIVSQSARRSTFAVEEYVELGKKEGENNLANGEPIPLVVAEIKENISEEVVVAFKFWDEDEWCDKEYTFHVYSEKPDAEYKLGGLANCYVLNPGGKGIAIPVKQANRSQFNDHIPDGEPLQVKYIWTDHSNGLGKDSNSPVKSAIIEGDGPEAFLIVTPGDVAGNAVIAVTNTQGKIYWSWHIWVVNDFDPGDETKEWKKYRYYEFLDRNLGALTADPTDVGSRGLYYQWGRKDPFPAAIGTKDSPSFSTIYKPKDSNPSEWEVLNWNPQQADWSWLNGQGDNCLQFTIENPNRFIRYSGGWFSINQVAHTNTMKDFWNETENGHLSTARKGIFDPCPDGWKTMPGTNSPNSAWTSIFAKVTYNTQYNYTRDEDLGDWPHAGYIDSNSGNLTNLQYGHYWSAMQNSYNEGLRTQIRTNGVEASTSQNKSNGLTIRCMRRVEE